MRRRIDLTVLLILSLGFIVLWFVHSCSTKNLLRNEKVGSIFVQSDTAGADILLDNTFTGKHTPDTLFNIKIGSHLVKVELEGYLSSPRSVIIEVQADTIIEASFAMLSLDYGFLRVNSNVQEAYIVIDNMPTGDRTPFLFDHNIPVGTHIVSVYKDGHSNDTPAKEIVEISTADTTELTFNLTPTPVGENVGDITDDFCLEDDYHEWHRLYAYRGFVCIINFWALSCPNCMAELPYLQQLYGEYLSDSLKLFALNYEDDFDIIQQKRNELGLTFTLLKDAGGLVKSDYELLGTPVTIIIDRSGEIYHYEPGFIESKADQFMSRFRQKLNELFGK
jgi:thiol-disulfide isomerase/thioredoxin